MLADLAQHSVPSVSLYARIVSRTVLTPALRHSMLALMHRCYDGVEPERFFADLDAKQLVILLYARQTKTLAGFSTVRLQPERLQGQRIELIFSGDTVIHPDYWGQKVLQAAFGRLILQRKLRHPWRPCVWLLLSKGLKTYLLMRSHFPHSFPQSERPMPPAYQALRDRLAHAWWPDAYQATRGILHFVPPRDAVKPHLQALAVDPHVTALPDAAFFLQQNPGYAQGDELVCLAHLRVVDIMRTLLRLAWRQGRLLLRGR